MQWFLNSREPENLWGFVNIHVSGVLGDGMEAKESLFT